MKRLESYARNLVDYHMILDLLPDLSRLYFLQRLPGVTLPRLQAGIVMGLGLQRTTVDALAAHFDVAVTQVRSSGGARWGRRPSLHCAPLAGARAVQQGSAEAQRRHHGHPRAGCRGGA